MRQVDFRELVFEAVKSLPGIFRQHMKNIDIVIQDVPSAEQLKSVTTARRGTLLGLYQGVPLDKRTNIYSNVLPDKITIFKKNIEAVCKTPDDIQRVVSLTVQHEIAHHFGISDDRLIDKGIY